MAQTDFLKGAAAAGLLVTVAVPNGVQAQTASPAQTASTGLEEIVVTAQRRAELLQTVPISVTALTASDLEAAGATGMPELSVAVPGLQVTNQSTKPNIFLRGIGSQSTNPGDEAVVASYIDGVYIAAPTANLFSFNNIERVEVLKGPQGTLFGRNATGGLINVISKDPSANEAFAGNISYGNYQTVEGSFYATGGSDALAVDLAFYGIHQGEGLGENIITGKDTYQKKELSVRSKLLWRPTDADRLLLSVDWNRNRSTLGASSDFLPGSRNRGFGSTGTPYNIQHDAESQGPVNNISYGFSGRYSHEFKDFTVSLLSAYRRIDQERTLDTDRTPQPRNFAFFNDEGHDFQQELLITGSTSRLDYTMGAFYFHSVNQRDPIKIRSRIIPSGNFDRFAQQNLNSYSVFGQGTYELFDNTDFTAGLRYTTDRYSFFGADVAGPGHPAGAGTTLITDPPGNTLSTTRKRRAKFSKLTWRLALDQKLSEDAMVYASYNRGFKSGGFNTGDFTPVFDPETLDALEVGLKSQLFDNTLRFNLSAFLYYYKNIQLSRTEAQTRIIFNAARARMKGVDLEALYAPRLSAGRLVFRVALSLLDGEYTDFPLGVQSTPNPAGGNTTVTCDENDVPVVCSLTGNNMIRAPKWTLNLGANYSVPIGQSELQFEANYYHNDGFYWQEDNRLREPAYDVINGQISLLFGADKQFSVRAFVRNLTDERYFAEQNATSAGDFGTYAYPRTYGVGVGVNF